MFKEFTMISAGHLSEFVGFTESEVQFLCERYKTDFLLCKRWYDGYQTDRVNCIRSRLNGTCVF